MSGCTPSQFVYTALSSSITLQANTAYYLASMELAGGDQWYNYGAISSTSVAAVSNAIYSANGSTWTAPFNVANTSYVPPNFTYLPPVQTTAGFITGDDLNNPAVIDNFTGWLGMEVVVGASALTVPSVGRICVAGNSGTHTVEFVSAATGTAVPGGSAVVNMSGCTPSQFVYTALSSSITLQANTAYYLASLELAGGDQWYNYGAISSTNVAAVSNAIYSANGSTWTAPSNVANTAYVPPNFTYLPPVQTTAGFITGYALNNPAVLDNFTGWLGMQVLVGASAL